MSQTVQCTHHSALSARLCSDPHGCKPFRRKGTHKSSFPNLWRYCNNIVTVTASIKSICIFTLCVTLHSRVLSTLLSYYIYIYRCSFGTCVPFICPNPNPASVLDLSILTCAVTTGPSLQVQKASHIQSEQCQFLCKSIAMTGLQGRL